MAGVAASAAAIKKVTIGRRIAVSSGFAATLVVTSDQASQLKRTSHSTVVQTKGNVMSDNIYKIVELVGSSANSIEDAIKGAIRRASSTVREIRWFEVVSTRGHVEDGEVAHYQVTIRIGFTLEE
jgi:dodecin